MRAPLCVSSPAPCLPLEDSRPGSSHRSPRKNSDRMSFIQTETLTEKENFTTYQLLVRFHLKVSSFIHDPNPLAPINQGVAFFFNLFNRAPSLDRHYQPGDQATPEAAGCVGHLVVPAHCSDTCLSDTPLFQHFFKQNKELISAKAC